MTVRDQVATVVMTRDRRAELLASLAHQQGPVLVVDNGSTDGTPAAVRALGDPRVRVIALAANRGAVARNIGVSMARTELVAFADDDSWWAPGALQRAAEVFGAHPRLGLLAGRMLVGPDQRLDPLCAELASAPLGQAADLPGPHVLGFMACGAVVRRRAFLECGGFDDVVFFPGEEERLALDLAAAGWGSCYVPEVVAHHHPTGRGGTGAARRTALVTRNHLLTAVLRRPWSVVTRRTLAALRAGPAERRGVVQALPRVLRACARRRVVPDTVERQLRILEGRV